MYRLSARGEDLRPRVLGGGEDDRRRTSFRVLVHAERRRAVAPGARSRPSLADGEPESSWRIFSGLVPVRREMTTTTMRVPQPPSASRPPGPRPRRPRPGRSPVRRPSAWSSALIHRGSGAREGNRRSRAPTRDAHGPGQQSEHTAFDYHDNLNPMFRRLVRLPERPASPSSFWGPRQTGKSTLLKELYPQAIRIDLATTEEFVRYSERPTLLREELEARPQRAASSSSTRSRRCRRFSRRCGGWSRTAGRVFAMSGSSSRASVRQAAPALPGARVARFDLFGLTSAEIGRPFDLLPDAEPWVPAAPLPGRRAGSARSRRTCRATSRTRCCRRA